MIRKVAFKIFLLWEIEANISYGSDPFLGRILAFKTNSVTQIEQANKYHPFGCKMLQQNAQRSPFCQQIPIYSQPLLLYSE